jgi:hypothetical protein
MVAHSIPVERDFTLAAHVPEPALSPGSFQGEGILLWKLSDLPQILIWCLNDTVRWIVPAVFFVVAVRRAADMRPWSVFFMLVALGASWLAFSQTLAGATTIVGSQPPALFGFINQYWQPSTLRFVFYTLPSFIITPATLIWACLDDRRRRRPRYWTHWAGAILHVALTLVGLARSFTI